jgi:predicted secreted protein
MKKFRVLSVLSALILSGFAVSAAAQDYKTVLDIPEGAALVSLSATENVEIEQDLLVAMLNYQAENANARALQDEINTRMKEALDTAKKVGSVKASTQQYYVYEYDPNAGKEFQPRQKLWRGSQGLMLKGKEADDLLELTGKLQEMGLSMNGLGYEVSPEKLEEARESLLEAALKKLTAKAQRTAKALGKSSAELKQISVDMGGYYPQPEMRAMAMDMAYGSGAPKMASPVAAAGESQISLTVSAQALLK